VAETLAVLSIRADGPTTFNPSIEGATDITQPNPGAAESSMQGPCHASQRFDRRAEQLVRARKRSERYTAKCPYRAASRPSGVRSAAGDHATDEQDLADRDRHASDESRRARWCIDDVPERSSRGRVALAPRSRRQLARRLHRRLRHHMRHLQPDYLVPPARSVAKGVGARTHIVRGLLCAKCNHMIGLAGDEPSIFISVARYLQRFLSQEKRAA